MANELTHAVVGEELDRTEWEAAATHVSSGLTVGWVYRASGATTAVFAAITASDLPTAIDAANIADASVSNAEFQYLDGVTSAIQTQIDTKAAGPGSSTDHAIARYDSTTGKILLDSSVTIDDSGNISAINKNLDIYLGHYQTKNLLIREITTSQLGIRTRADNAYRDLRVMNLQADGNISIRASSELRFYDNGNYVGFEAPALSADKIWVLPTADGSANDFLQTDGSATLTWAASAGAAHAILDGSTHNDSVADAVTRGSLIIGNSSSPSKWDELVVGNNGEVLTTDGTDISWGAAGSGDVTKVGTPANNQIGVWTGDGTLEGDTEFLFDDTTFTVGADGTGKDVRFNSATAGDFLFWDASEEQLTITGTNGQLALDIADGNLKVVDTFYLFDAGGESLSSDGTNLTINSGALINLTATSDVVIPVNIGLHFGDGAEKIESNNTDLTINSGADIALTATDDINIPVNVGLEFAGAEKIESDGTDLTITVGAGGDINIGADIGITFGDDGEKIEGNGTDLTISGNNINLTAAADVIVPANVGITFGTGEKIEGNNTDLTITSGADIALTATGDVNIPANVGVKFGDDGEGIEGDGTDLSITSSNLLNLTATGGVVLNSFMQLIENAGITLDAALSADEKYCGITEPGTAGATLDFGDCVYHDVTAGEWLLAKADVTATSGAVKVGINVTVAQVADGNAMTVLLWGKVRSDSDYAFTVDAPVFISAATAGDLTSTAPSGTTNFVVRIVGYGNTADELYFCPDNTYLELA